MPAIRVICSVVLQNRGNEKKFSALGRLLLVARDLFIAFGFNPSYYVREGKKG